MFSRLVLLVFHLIQYCKSQDIYCCNGTVRLAGGSLSNEGRVEICQSGQWKTVCDNNWGVNEARVVCSQLGFATQAVVPLTQSMFGTGTGMIVEQVRCSGTESRLADCTIRDVADGECNHNEDAGVRCSCRNGDLRLQGSTTQGRGRVEICLNNEWGTICDNLWSSLDARIVCKQLGFSRIGASSLCCATYSQGSGPIHMDRVRCVGSERFLIDCPHNRSLSCTHAQDAAVQCQPRIVCYDGDVRLVNGSQPYRGRVEVCLNEVWGTICADTYRDWSSLEANVVCKQLGYPGAYNSSYNFGTGSAPIHMNYVYCTGIESTIANCTYYDSGSSSCNDGIIGVECKSDQRNNGDLRLTGGLARYEGRVEIFWNSEWRTICSDGWDYFDAHVVCRQLHYLSTSVEVQAITFDESNFKSTQMVLANLGCSGAENNLTSCCSVIISNNTYCRSRIYAGVRCSQCIEHSVQLVGELSRHGGSPVICLGGGWNKVCHTNTRTAEVICRQLGFSAEDSTIHYDFNFDSIFHDDNYNRYDWSTNVWLPFSIDYVQCTSNKTQLSQCEYMYSYTRFSSCDYIYNFKINCQTSRENIPGSPQNLKISNSSSSTLTLSWSPTLVSEIHGLTISTYIINCSTGPQTQNNMQIIKYTDFHSTTFLNLHPFTFYNCCVAAVSNHGRGKLACINTVTAPSGAPIQLQSTLINSTTILFSWNAPNTEHASGILRGYYVQVIDNRTGFLKNYTTDNTHFLFNNLRPNHQYTFRVAASTNFNERGPFSQLTAITTDTSLPIVEDVDTTIDIQHQNQGPLVATSSMLGFVSFILLIVAIAASICIGYRLKKRDKKVTRPAQVPVYEMVDMPPRGDSCSKPENLSQEHRDINVEQLIFKQDQAKNFSHMPHEYLTPTFTKFNQSAGPGQAVAANEENAYQPLIPPRIRALGDDKSEYQSLTQKPSTLPAKINISPMAMGPAPPAIPPKPKAM